MINLITSQLSELFAEDIHFLLSNTTKFVKYLEVLSNISVFDRKLFDEEMILYETMPAGKKQKKMFRIR